MVTIHARKERKTSIQGKIAQDDKGLICDAQRSERDRKNIGIQFYPLLKK